MRPSFLEALEPRTLLTTLPAGFQQDFVARVQTDVATSMAIAPDGRIFIADNRTGNVCIVKNDKLLSTPFAHVAVDNYRERGIEGIALDPDFVHNGFVYVYYTHADPSNPNTSPNGAMNQVSRFKASATNGDLADSKVGEQVILKGIPSFTGVHNGGFLHFGKDGMLYLGIGDFAASNTRIQDLSQFSGKLLRLDVKNYPNIIPSDNPFVHTAGALPEIYALGFRNPFSGDVDPVSGSIFVNDVGFSTWEEINELNAGGNYGWPGLEGAQHKPGFIDPIYEYNHNGASAAITGGTFYEGDQFPASFKGKYFFADYVNHYIHVLDPLKKTTASFATNTPTFLDFDVAPDGSLYCLDVEGSLYKISYVGIANRPPNAIAAADVTNGQLPLTVNFDGGESDDPDGDPLTYAWDFGDGTTGEGKTASHEYDSAGNFSATLTVTDDHNNSNTTKPIIITAGNTTPDPTISLPEASATYAAGETIQFSGDATDFDDGTLPDSAFHWSIVFHHQTHTHPFIDAIDGVKAGSFQIPITGETDPMQWYRIHLTVTDFGGLSKDVFTDVHPLTNTITLASNFSGIQLDLDGAPFATPTSTLGVVGMGRTIAAPPTVNLNGNTYQFVSWSDDGAASHDILTPGTDTTFTATYKVLPATNLTLTPTADAYVQDGANASKNFGGNPLLFIKKASSGFNRETYLMFDLSSVGSIGKAILNLFGGNSASGSVQIAAYKTATTWTESGIKYSNRPAASGGALATLTIKETAAHTRQLDLTSFLKSELGAGHKQVAIVIKATSTGDPVVTLSSREAKSNGPQLLITPAQPITSTTLDAAADAYVRGGASASANFGATTTINIKNATADNQREGYLKFDLTNVSSITSAKLRLFGSLSDVTASNIVTQVFGAIDTSWGEGTITFKNRPATSGSAIASAKVLDAIGRWYEFDVTAYLKSQKAAGKNAVTLVLRNPNGASPFTTFNSREATTNRPQLVIT